MKTVIARVTSWKGALHLSLELQKPLPPKRPCMMIWIRSDNVSTKKRLPRRRILEMIGTYFSTTSFVSWKITPYDTSLLVPSVTLGESIVSASQVPLFTVPLEIVLGNRVQSYTGSDIEEKLIKFIWSEYGEY